ncbi:MAG: hypothetical protein AAB472_02205 [Patescibacteria group bacterium]
MNNTILPKEIEQRLQALASKLDMSLLETLEEAIEHLEEKVHQEENPNGFVVRT